MHFAQGDATGYCHCHTATHLFLASLFSDQFNLPRGPILLELEIIDQHNLICCDACVFLPFFYLQLSSLSSDHSACNEKRSYISSCSEIEHVLVLQ